MAQFLSQGGFGFYVWASYGMTALVVVVEIVRLRAARRAAIARARATRGEPG